jgi:hypothetical protein
MALFKPIVPRSSGKIVPFRPEPRAIFLFSLAFR